MAHDSIRKGKCSQKRAYLTNLGCKTETMEKFHTYDCGNEVCSFV